jgi:threonine/homoserine/homoserine lactone efflux protein
MTGIILTMSVAGLLAGFIFSMPIAGPVSILITSNALKGRLRYCNLASIGASFADFIYVFIAIFGLTRLYSLYKPAIPYILSAGAVFLLYIGYRTIKTKIDIEHLEDEHPEYKVGHRDKGALYTGFMVNFLNPTLFIGWLTSSFFVITFMATLGFNTGGLDTIINQNVKEMNIIEGVNIEKPQAGTSAQFDKIRTWNSEMQKKYPVKLTDHFHLIISICYAFFLSLGSIIWFYILAFFINRFRHHINVKIINVIVYSMGIVLCIFGIYFGYVSIRMFFSIVN